MKKETNTKPIVEKPFFKDKSDAGKGDRPRNISRAYWDNWDLINWHRDEGKVIIKIDKNTTAEF